jgi:hypothetical protein
MTNGQLHSVLGADQPAQDLFGQAVFETMVAKLVTMTKDVVKKWARVFEAVFADKTNHPGFSQRDCLAVGTVQVARWGHDTRH